VELNDSIASAVHSLSATGYNIHLVNINSGTLSQALPCNTTTNGTADINPLLFAPGAAFATIISECDISVATLMSSCSPSTASNFWQNIVATGSFHPKASAHTYMASQVEAAFG
jgi:hypothetical protein